MPHRPSRDPGVACAEHGEVLLDGPGSVALSLTADAAEETGRRLRRAAWRARRQTVEHLDDRARIT